MFEIRALENKDKELKIIAKVNDYSLSKELSDLKGNKFRESNLQRSMGKSNSKS